MHSITTAEATSWKNELDAMLGDVTDSDALASLTHLRSALEPYFATPELFRSMFGRITPDPVRVTELVGTSFANLDDLKAALPEGLTVTAQ